MTSMTSDYLPQLFSRAETLAINLRLPLCNNIFPTLCYIFDTIRFQNIAATYDSLTTEIIGQSYEGRDQRVVKICQDGCGTKNIMYVEGGIHAREWMSPAVVTYFINELTVNAANNMDMLENLDWLVCLIYTQYLLQ